MSRPAIVRAVRSGVEESVHLADVAVVDAEGGLLSYAGDPTRIVFARSSMKPLQASVSMSLAPLDFTVQEVAVMCASHNAEPVHIDAVRSLLRRGGVAEAALQTPPKLPWDAPSLVASPERRPINSDCSGKHAGMLAACVAQGWSLESYRDPEHPLQEAIAAAVATAARAGPVDVGVDGCGVPVHAMPLRALATIYASLVAPDGLGPLGVHAERAVAAMRAEPYLVAGRKRVDTAVMEASATVVVKSGAEAVICAAMLDRRHAIAAKVRDGSSRAAGPVVIETLSLLGALSQEQLDRLRAHARPPLLGGGEPVGSLDVRVELVGP